MNKTKELFELAMNVYIDSVEPATNEAYRTMMKIIADQANRDGVDFNYEVRNQ